MRRLSALAAVGALVVASGCHDGGGRDTAPPPPTRSPLAARPLPTAVAVRSTPQGITLGDPTFTALAGARAKFGRLGGAVYQIEVPKHWDGRLVLFMHGYEELRPTANVGPPDIRNDLVSHGIAWAASSFSSTGLVPGRAADESAALWDFFARNVGRPRWSYVMGFSMGGLATHIASERYADRFDGALALCGSAGATPGTDAQADFFAAGAYAAGVTQQEFDNASSVHALIEDRIRPALRDPQRHRRFEDIMIDLSGGPRAFDRAGFEAEEATNWHRADQQVTVQIAGNAHKEYALGASAGVASAVFNRDVVRFTQNRANDKAFAAGNDLTGEVRMPLVSMHTTGDFQVPFGQARILQQLVDQAGAERLLVQRVVQDPGHCGFTTPEQFASFTALVGWVEHGDKPSGSDVMAADLRKLDRTYELSPRAGSPQAEAVAGADDRVVARGRATLDGRPFDAPYIGAAVLTDGLVTPCQYTLPPVTDGRVDITVLADTESRGCGRSRAQIALWTFVDDQFFYSTNTVSWPDGGRVATFDAHFTRAQPNGAVPVTASFNGEVYGRDHRKLPAGTVVEAYVGTTRCGIASTRRTGSFTGYILGVVGPDAIPGCRRGAPLTLRVNGQASTHTAAVNTPPGARESLNLTMQ